MAEHLEGDSIAAVLDAAQQAGGTWFVGGSFDPLDARAEWWAPFGAARAWRPAEVLSVQDVPARGPAPPTRSTPHPAPALGMHPNRDAWKALVDRVVTDIGRGDFDKVVLARTIAEAADTDALTWLHGDRGDREMAFLYEPAPGLAFAGRTPELLFDRQGTTVHSEALAGTDLDSPAGRERLLASDKDAREHALVVDAVSSALASVCTSVEPSGLQLAVAGRLVHRLVSFVGQLRQPVRDARLAEHLHPTPAVAGTPRRDAVAFLREHEPFDRGWYAGPVGLIEPGRTTLSVALRCALWSGQTRIAFAGAGLVAGSNAQTEWDETELKSLAVRRR